MSATVDAAPLKAYFGGDAAVIDVPGRTFPVDVRHLEEVLPLLLHSRKPIVHCVVLLGQAEPFGAEPGGTIHRVWEGGVARSGSRGGLLGRVLRFDLA